MSTTSVAPQEGIPWHAISPEDVAKKLSVSLEGLSGDEVASRRAQYGSNKLPEAKGRGWVIIFLSQFKSSLIYVLIAADIIVFWLKEFTDAFIILFVLLFNAIIGTIQEGRAQNTLSALKKFVTTRATVLRDGKEVVVEDHEIVPGDIIMLDEGEKIPADARLIRADNLKLEEAALTGESTPVRKSIEILEKVNLPTAERKNMVFKGTSISVGYGKAIVVATGLDTAIGQISKSISEIESEIPLQKSLDEFSRIVVAITIVVIAILFALGISRGIGTTEMFVTAVSIAVAAVPEGLPLVLTVILAMGVWKMAKRKVLVKKLQAVEALGQARVIAVDKTGTITKNELIIQKVDIGGHTHDIEGIGYIPEPILPESPALKLAGTIAAMCANAKIVPKKEKGAYQVIGDPTEAAMMVFAKKAGIDRDALTASRIQDWPFDYELKYHRALYHYENKKMLAMTGAPEIVLDLCDTEWNEEGNKELSKERKQQLENQFINLSKDGLRVIAFAFHDDANENEVKNKLPKMTLGGFYAMKDGLREGINSQVESARKAGIKVIMITGDHKVAAHSIAREAGIWKEGDNMMTGEELDGISEEEFMNRLADVTVFARVTPDHKKKIIQGYKKRNEVIAMTGDGVNDAPSLVAADLGIAMGKIGTEVTKEASDLVLMEDNFGDIMNAVEEGRGMRQGIKRTIIYLFSSNVGEIIVIGGALFMGYPIPLLAAQIIWMNVVTDTFFDISLALEPQGKELLEPRYAKPKKLFDGLMAKRMMVIGPVMSIGTLYLYINQLNIEPGNIMKAQTVALTSLVIFQWFNSWNCRSEDKSIFQLNFFANKFLLVTLVLVAILHPLALYTPVLNNLLGTVTLSLKEIGFIAIIAISVLIAEELRKLIFRKMALRTT
jgi:P-type Ca2+ transporter type 2C